MTFDDSRVVFYTRANCPLCDDALAVVSEVCDEFGETFTQVDIDQPEQAGLDAAQLRAQYGELVPVVTVAGQQIGFWRIDPQRLRAALADR